MGRDAARIAQVAGFEVPEATRLLFFDAPADHPFAVIEQMMPVLPLVRAGTAREAIDLAVHLEHGYHHTAAMHSKDLDNLDYMANAINTSIFVKNGPCLAGLGFGGEGWTTMTISTPTGEGVTCAASFIRLRPVRAGGSFPHRMSTMARDFVNWLTPRLDRAAELLRSPPTEAVKGPLRLGIDLGTSDVVSIVIDAEDHPVAVQLKWADVVRDGIVWDYFGAVNIVRHQVAALQEQLGVTFTEACTSFPPGTDPRISVNVIEAAGLEVTQVIDEPSAVARLLELDRGAVVDIGGGTTGIAVVQGGPGDLLRRRAHRRPSCFPDPGRQPTDSPGGGRASQDRKRPRSVAGGPGRL